MPMTSTAPPANCAHGVTVTVGVPGTNVAVGLPGVAVELAVAVAVCAVAVAVGVQGVSVGVPAVAVGVTVPGVGVSPAVEQSSSSATSVKSPCASWAGSAFSLIVIGTKRPDP